MIDHLESFHNLSHQKAKEEMSENHWKFGPRSTVVPQNVQPQGENGTNLIGAVSPEEDIDFLNVDWVNLKRTMLNYIAIAANMI